MLVNGVSPRVFKNFTYCDVWYVKSVTVKVIWKTDLKEKDFTTLDISVYPIVVTYKYRLIFIQLPSLTDFIIIAWS